MLFQPGHGILIVVVELDCPIVRKLSSGLLTGFVQILKALVLGP